MVSQISAPPLFFLPSFLSLFPFLVCQLLRYYLLLRHGGIYLDIDMVLVGPISKAFPSLDTPTPALQTALGAHGGAFQVCDG